MASKNFFEPGVGNEQRLMCSRRYCFRVKFAKFFDSNVLYFFIYFKSYAERPTGAYAMSYKITLHT